MPDPRKAAVADDEDAILSTHFNGLEVPPMVQLNGTSYKEDISKGWWLVEAFSPWCGHCKSLAPKLQTTYEYYYTSSPIPTATDQDTKLSTMNSFTRYYDFRFAKIDCVAFGTACGSDLGVASYPTLFIFHDGKEMNKSTGDRSMEKLSGFIEETLEMIKPGSRPKGGPELPAVGDKSSPGQTSTQERQPQQNIGDVSGSSTATDGKTKTVTKWGGNPNYKVAPAAFIQPHTEQNPKGVSLNFTAALFEEEVVKSLDPWFVKFYAPWCPHCQHMAPAWAAMAKEMKGKLNVGEVNCDIEKKLCKEHGVRSYPSMKLLRGPEKIEYDGLRGVGDLVDFGNRISENLKGVTDVTLAEFEELEKTEEVIFIYFYDVATAQEDFQALERLPLHLNGRAKLVKTQDPDLVKKFRISTWPRLVVSRDGQKEVYNGLSPKQMRDVPSLVEWIQGNWLPIVPELTAANAMEIMKEKYVVLGILTRDRPHEFESGKREIKNSAIEWMERSRHAFELERQELRDAKQLRVEEAQDRDDERALRDAKLIKIDMDTVKRKGVAFAWVDGVFWQRWIKTTFGVSVQDGEKVIIYDDDVSGLQPWLDAWMLICATESPLLGLDGHRQSDCALADIHPRNSAQSGRITLATALQGDRNDAVASGLQDLEASARVSLHSSVRRSWCLRWRPHSSSTPELWEPRLLQSQREGGSTRPDAKRRQRQGRLMHLRGRAWLEGRWAQVV